MQINSISNNQQVYRPNRMEAQKPQVQNQNQKQIAQQHSKAESAKPKQEMQHASQVKMQNISQDSNKINTQKASFEPNKGRFIDVYV